MSHSAKDKKLDWLEVENLGQVDFSWRKWGNEKVDRKDIKGKRGNKS